MFPNDMKYLAILAGELSNSAKYFSSFANINKDDIGDVTATFGVKTSNKWQPWGYAQRIAVAGAVAKKKEELGSSGSHLKPATIRQKVTSFIAQKKSRQEFLPLLGKAIDKVKVEPLHVKNNGWQKWHSTVLKYVLARTNVSSCESVNDTPASSCFKWYYETVRFTLKAGRLAKKVRKWFCDGRLKNKDLEYRFIGKESLIMCHQFMTLLSALELEDDQPVHNFALHVCATIAVNLRDSVSTFSRIKVTDKEVTSLTGVTRDYFRACALFSSVSPTTWTIGHCVAAHTKQIKQKLGVGLGVNTMEGRESKHVSLARFARNTHHSTPWVQVFRHEYISLIWLRENRCDLVKHTPTRNKYIPARCFTATFCHCGNQKPRGEVKCTFCSHPIQQTIDDCIKQGKLTAQAKSLAANARGLI